MDDWTTKYLDGRRADFHDKPDAQQCIDFLEQALQVLETVSEDPHSQRHAASAIAASIQSQTNQQSLLRCLQTVLFEAASTSSLQPEHLANVTSLFIDQTPKLAGKFQYDMVTDIRERWNGESRTSDCLVPETHSRDQTQIFQTFLAMKPRRPSTSSNGSTRMLLLPT